MTAGEVANPRPEPRPSFTGNLKEQFRALARAILAPAVPAPAETRKKKREDQTRGGLMITASRFMRHILRRQFHNAKADLAREIPKAAAVPTVPDYAAATAYLSDTLDWLNLWEENGSDFEADEFQPARADHLYPHL